MLICYAYGTPASCARSLNRKPDAYDLPYDQQLYTNSYQARYPPLYYFVVGLPSPRIDDRPLPDATRLGAVLGALSRTRADAALVYSRNRSIVLGLALR